jgi:hypothetical protein
MAQRNSEYVRQPGDEYVTPDWVWGEFHKHFPEFRGAFTDEVERGNGPPIPRRKIP